MGGVCRRGRKTLLVGLVGFVGRKVGWSYEKIPGNRQVFIDFGAELSIDEHSRKTIDR